MINTIKIKDDFKINNENHASCSQCGGKCCKSAGCHYSPRDFSEITPAILKKILDMGFVSIDWWEGDVFGNNRSRTYYLRIRHKGKGIIDPSWGGECMLLTETGCKLSFDERPMGGRVLEPKGSIDKCTSKYTKEDCCKEWYSYQDLFDEIIDMYY